MEITEDEAKEKLEHKIAFIEYVDDHDIQLVVDGEFYEINCEWKNKYD